MDNTKGFDYLASKLTGDDKFILGHIFDGELLGVHAASSFAFALNNGWIDNPEWVRHQYSKYGVDYSEHKLKAELTATGRAILSARWQAFPKEGEPHLRRMRERMGVK